MKNFKVVGRTAEDRFAANWVRGGFGNSLRRRLFAILRLAHRTLGVGRKNLGLGGLGSTGVSALLASIGVITIPSVASAQYVAGTGVASGTATDAVAISAGPAAATVYSLRDIGIGAGATAGSAANLYSNEIAIGSFATATGTGAIAFGQNASATGGLGNVAIGRDSATLGALNIVTQLGLGFPTYAGIADSVFAIGNGSGFGLTRQLQYVAPGSLTATSTDAVNGSQLFSVYTGLSTGISTVVSTSSTAESNLQASASKRRCHGTSLNPRICYTEP